MIPKSSSPNQSNSDNQINVSNSSGVVVNTGSVSGGIYNGSSQQNVPTEDLISLAKDITQLLDQASVGQKINTKSEKRMIAWAAISKIEDDLLLKGKLLRAIQAGLIASLEQLLSHPVSSFFISAIAEWQEDS